MIELNIFFSTVIHFVSKLFLGRRLLFSLLFFSGLLKHSQSVCGEKGLLEENRHRKDAKNDCVA